MTKKNVFQNFQHINISFPLQKNSYDCGVYVCVLMRVIGEKFVNGTLFYEKEILCETNMAKERETILSEIFCGKLFRREMLSAILTKDSSSISIVKELPTWLLTGKFRTEVIIQLLS